MSEEFRNILVPTDFSDESRRALMHKGLYQPVSEG
jgi:hypothetical protein